jgi:CBS domain-containing protein
MAVGPGPTTARRYDCAMPQVASIMSTGVLTVEPSVTAAQAARRMVERRVGAVVVVEDGRPVGIFTERDALRLMAAGTGGEILVGECMTPHPETISPSDDMDHASLLMIHGGFRHLPVLDGGALVGIVSIRDIVRVTIGDAAPRGV